MKRMNKLIIGLVALLVLVGCSSKNNTDGGNLVIYSPSSEGIINAVIPLFEEETGIKVELISASTGELLKRIESESDSPGGDVLFGVSYSQTGGSDATASASTHDDETESRLSPRLCFCMLFIST